LLPACSTYDNKIDIPGNQKREVYTAEIYVDKGHAPFDDILNGDYDVLNVDTD
jgi:hypothetical protein